jgi:transmembrane sensor
MVAVSTNAQDLPSAPFSAIYATAVGEQRSVSLPDHSLIKLNTNTEVHVRYTADTRQLEMLRGEANFQVAKDHARVFTVNVHGYEFKAVGTAFDIRDRAQGVRLTVTEGRVRVHRPPPLGETPALPSPTAPAFEKPGDVEIGAGKEIVVGRTPEPERSLGPEQIRSVTAWQRGMLSFDGAPLSEVVGEFARYSTKQFVLGDPEIGKVRVSGYFRVGDIDALSAALISNFGIDVTESNNQILLAAHSSK